MSNRWRYPCSSQKNKMKRITEVEIDEESGRNIFSYTHVHGKNMIRFDRVMRWMIRSWLPHRSVGHRAYN
jgi:hypothetical protein